MSLKERRSAHHSGTGDISPLQHFEQRHQIPGVADALNALPWLDPILVKYFRHFPEGAVDSLRVGVMVYSYAEAHPDKYDKERTLTLTAAGLAHDGGKPDVLKEDLGSDQVYTREERMVKLAHHVEAGVRRVIGQDDAGEIDYTGVDAARVRVALIGGGHHLNQDDRGSYPPENTSWLQTDDPTILEDREVLQIADRVEAQRSARSYKKSFSEEETQANLRAQGLEGEIVNFMLAEFNRQATAQEAA
jgi:hypothetical protein